MLITSARYFRQFAHGRAQDRLPVGPEEAFVDLREWRLAQGLAPQPDVAVVSSSLNIPASALEAYAERRRMIFTGEDAEHGRVAELEALGVTVTAAGDGARVDGRLLVQHLADAGYRSIYAIAGPQVLHTLAASRVLDYLFLTTAHRVIGGESFDTLSWGPALEPPLSLALQELYYDAHAPEGAGQCLAVYRCNA